MAGKRYRVVGIDLKLGDGQYIPEGETVELDGEPDADIVRWLKPVDAEASNAPAASTAPPKATGNGGRKAAAKK